MFDLCPEEIEELGDPLRMIWPGLCRHEIAVGRHLIDPGTPGGFDFGPDGRVGRHLISVEDIRSDEDLRICIDSQAEIVEELNSLRPVQ